MTKPTFRHLYEVKPNLVPRKDVIAKQGVVTIPWEGDLLLYARSTKDHINLQLSIGGTVWEMFESRHTPNFVPSSMSFSSINEMGHTLLFRELRELLLDFVVGISLCLSESKKSSIALPKIIIFTDRDIYRDITDLS